MTPPQPRDPRQASEAPWWDHPHDIRTREHCAAALTPDPRTRCTRRTHPTNNTDRDSWHTWSAVTWGTAPPDRMARGIVRAGPGRFTTVADLVRTLLGDPQ